MKRSQRHSTQSKTKSCLCFHSIPIYLPFHSINFMKSITFIKNWVCFNFFSFFACLFFCGAMAAGQPITHKRRRRKKRKGMNDLRNEMELNGAKRAAPSLKDKWIYLLNNGLLVICFVPQLSNHQLSFHFSFSLSLSIHNQLINKEKRFKKDWICLVFGLCFGLFSLSGAMAGPPAHNPPNSKKPNQTEEADHTAAGTASLFFH